MCLRSCPCVCAWEINFGVLHIEASTLSFRSFYGWKVCFKWCILKTIHHIMSEQANKQANFPKCTVEFIAWNHICMCRVYRRQAHKRLSYKAPPFLLSPIASALYIVVIWSTFHHSFSLLAFPSSLLPKWNWEWERRRWWHEIPMFNMHNNRHTKLCFPTYKTTIIPRKNTAANNNNNTSLALFPASCTSRKTSCPTS